MAHQRVDAEDKDIPDQPRVEIRRKVVLSPEQWLGLPVLVAIPLLALLGAFGETTREVTAERSLFSETVTYPARLRYRQSSAIRVVVTNRSESEIDTIKVAIDKAYLFRFAGVRFEPAPASDLSVPLVGIRPGESRAVVVELAGESYGRTVGRVVAKSVRDSAVAPMSTFVFP